MNKKEKVLKSPIYVCEACGHPDANDGQTDMCAHCGADDFLPTEAYNLGKPFFRALAKQVKTKDTDVYFTQAGALTPLIDAAYWVAILEEGGNRTVYRMVEGKFDYLAYSETDDIKRNNNVSGSDAA